LNSGIYDAINIGDVNTKLIGRRYILLSSFVVDPRYMIQHYQDAIAICRAMGLLSSLLHLHVTQAGLKSQLLGGT